MLRGQWLTSAKQMALLEATLFERSNKFFHPTLQCLRRFASQSYVSDAHKVCFDARYGHRLVTSLELQLQDRITDAIFSPSLQTVDQIQILIGHLPDDLAHSLVNIENIEGLTEIVLDIGRKPFAWIAGERCFIGDTTITEDQIRKISSSLRFGSDNRAGIDGCLHSISAMKNRENDIIGLTLRVGRYIHGNAMMIADILHGTDAAVLFVGPTGSGKTSILRDVARLLAEKSSVTVVDTSCEIGGDGDVPHECIGLARRVMVKNFNDQAKTMIETLHNHTPTCMIIDEIGRKSEVHAAMTCKERGVRIIASTHGSLLGLVRNKELCDLVGGIETVTMGDEMSMDEAKTQNKTTAFVSKLRSQRTRPPVLMWSSSFREENYMSGELFVQPVWLWILFLQMVITRLRFGLATNMQRRATYLYSMFSSWTPRKQTQIQWTQQRGH